MVFNYMENENNNNVETIAPIPEASLVVENKEFLNDKVCFWIGLFGCFMFSLSFLSPLVMLVKESAKTNWIAYEFLFILLYYIFITGTLILEVFILNKITKALKVTLPSWKKALFVIGVPVLFSVIIKGLVSSLVMQGILDIVSLVLLIIIAQKLYSIKLWKAVVLWLSSCLSIVIFGGMSGLIFAVLVIPMQSITQKGAVVNAVITPIQNLSWVEYKNDELGISFQYPNKYGEAKIKKIPEGNGFYFLGSFTKGNDGFASDFFGGKSINNSLNDHMPDSIDDTIKSYGDKIKISDISGVNTTGIILSENPQTDSNPLHNWREVIFDGNNSISNLVFFRRLDVLPEYIDIMKTVKIFPSVINQ